MRWLLWKEYRHNRLIVFAGLFLLLAPYVIATCFGFGERWFDWSKDFGPAYRPTRWVEIFAAAAIWGVTISQFTLALVGGNAIAGERVERTAEFLYSLPIPRRRMVASKLLLASLITAVIWLPNATILWCLMEAAGGSAGDLHKFLQPAMDVALTGLTFFCVAWFLSCYIASPVFAICGR